VLPLRTEVVTLEELNERESKKANGEVEAIGSELAAGKVIKTVVVFEFPDHLLEQSPLLVEVDDGLGIFVFLWDVGGNDPIVVLTVEEVALVVTTGTLDDKAKGVGTGAEGVDGLGNVVVGLRSIDIMAVFPCVFGDVVDGLHHS